METYMNLIEQYMDRTDFEKWDWETTFNTFEPMFRQNGFRNGYVDGQQHILLIWCFQLDLSVRFDVIIPRPT